MSNITSPLTFNLTAINAVDGYSILECWALKPGFVTSTQTGTIGSMSLQLGNLANASYSEIPAHFEPGLHNAPNVQYVLWLSGEAIVTLPKSKYVAHVKGGENGLIFAADLKALSTLGHNTSYPSDKTTRMIQIPTMDGLIPAHDVLHEGPCLASEMGGADHIATRSLGPRTAGLEELD